MVSFLLQQAPFCSSHQFPALSAQSTERRKMYKMGPVYRNHLQQLPAVTAVCSADASAHHNILLSGFCSPQRQASLLQPPAWPTISVDTAPEVVEHSNWVTACHFLLLSPSHEPLLLTSGDPFLFGVMQPSQSDSISASSQRSWRNSFQSWVRGMNVEGQEHHS